DAVTVSKALGGGLVPLAACIAAPDLHSEAFALSHGSTFANDNLTCAAGLAVLDALEADGGALLARVRASGARLPAGLEDVRARYPGVFREVRGRGLLVGLELEPVEATSSCLVRHLDEVHALCAVAASWLLNVEGVRVIPSLSHGRTLRI